MRDGLQLRFLGELEIIRDGARVALPPSRKTRALLAYLVVRGGAQRREHLCSLLWEIPDDPRGALRWSLTKLRALVDGLDRPRIVADRSTVAFDCAGVAVDVLELREACATDLGRLPEEDLVRLAHAYRGAFLADLELADLHEFHAWCLAEREDARARHTKVLTSLLGRLANRPDAALPFARALVDLDPGSEAARVQLLELLRRADRHTEAEQQFELAMRYFAEIGAEAALRLRAAWQARSMSLRAAEGEPPSDPQPIPSLSRATRSSSATRELGTAERERKQLTVLVAQLRIADDFQAADPERDLERLQGPLHAMMEAVHRYGGTVSGIDSDGITALFGAPFAHEDHAARACFAAAALREAVARAGTRGVAVRAGLHSGEAVVGLIGSDQVSQYGAVGAVVRLAQSQLGMVEAAVTLTAETAKRAEGFVEVRHLDVSMEAPEGRHLELLELLHTAPQRSRWEVRAAQGLTRFVGRDDEFARLGDALDRAIGGRGNMVAIVGEPGLGKSRLVHELVTSDRTRACTVLEASATPYDAQTTYFAIGTLLRSWLDVEEGATTSAIAARVQARIDALDPALASAVPVLFALLDIPVEDPEWNTLTAAKQRRRTLDCLKALFFTMSARAPLVLLFEDLHWIDDGSQGVLDTLVDALGGARILLMVTYRPEYRHEWASKSWFAQIRLQPLGVQAGEELLTHLLGEDPELASLKELLIARTEGIPLFQEEAVRELIETGALIGSPGAYRLVEPIHRLELPSSVQAVLAARIDRLPRSARTVLQIGAVIGQIVPLSLLELITDLVEDDLRLALAELQSAELMFETRLLPEVEYAFKHALTQAAAYNNLLADRRRAIHLDVVRAIETRHADRLDEHVERLAHHALAAEQWHSAVAYLSRAATRAIKRSAHQQAIDLLNRALAVLEGLPASRWRSERELDLQNAMGVTMMAAKGWGAQEVVNAYERAQVLCEQLADQQQLFTVLRGKGQFYMIRGELETARALGTRCVELASASGDLGVRLETHHLFWSNSFFMGDYENADSHSESGISLYERDRDHPLTYLYSGHDPGVCCRCFSGLIRWQRGEPERALGRCHEARALAEPIGHPLTLALAYWGLSYVHMFRREPQDAYAWANREIELCSEYLLPLLLSQGLFQMGWALAQLGEIDVGIAKMEEGRAAIRATGAEMGLPYFAALLGEAYAKKGRVTDGLAEIQSAIETASRNGANFQLPEILRLKGDLLAMGRGQLKEAAACYHEAAEVARRQGARGPELRAATSLARLSSGKRMRRAAHERLAGVYNCFAEGLDTPDLKEARALLDELG